MEDVYSSQQEKMQSAKGKGYPSETLAFCLEITDKMTANVKSGEYITRAAFANVMGKVQGALSLFFSTLKQYNIVIEHKGKGFETSTFYERYKLSNTYEEKNKIMRRMFAAASLNSWMIANYAGKRLSSDKDLASEIRKELGILSPEKALAIFTQNIKDLNCYDKYSHIFSFTTMLDNDTGAVIFDSSSEHFVIRIPIGSRSAFVRLNLDYTVEEIEKIINVLNGYGNAKKIENSSTAQPAISSINFESYY